MTLYLKRILSHYLSHYLMTYRSFLVFMFLGFHTEQLTVNIRSEINLAEKSESQRWVPMSTQKHFFFHISLSEPNTNTWWHPDTQYPRGAFGTLRISASWSCRQVQHVQTIKYYNLCTTVTVRLSLVSIQHKDLFKHLVSSVFTGCKSLVCVI